MCFVDSVPPDFFRTEERRARKSHQCTECGGAIEVGSRYTFVAGRWDGGAVSTFKICAPCTLLRARIAEHEIAEGCDSFEAWCPLGMLGDYLVETGKLCAFRDELSARSKTKLFPIALLRDAFMALPVEQRRPQYIGGEVHT